MSNHLEVYFPVDLIEHLEKIFPDKIPDYTSCDIDELRVKQGQVSVVRYLRRQYSIQLSSMGTKRG